MSGGTVGVEGMGPEEHLEDGEGGRPVESWGGKARAKLACRLLGTCSGAQRRLTFVRDLLVDSPQLGDPGRGRRRGQRSADLIEVEAARGAIGSGCFSHFLAVQERGRVMT